MVLTEHGEGPCPVRYLEGTTSRDNGWVSLTGNSSQKTKTYVQSCLHSYPDGLIDSFGQQIRGLEAS